MSERNGQQSEILGWGADLSPKRRPGARREANRENVLAPRGDEYEKIPRQVPKVEILVSTEHRKLTPIFGTACPPRGLSGAIRRFAFRMSEGKKSHWMLLLFADRVNVWEAALSNFVRGKSHNPFKEMGWSAELKRGAFRSRFGHNRADIKRWGQEAALATVFVGAFLVNRGIKSGVKSKAEKRSA